MQDTAHMQMEELGHAIGKGLELWSLQAVADAAILLSLANLAVVVGRCYPEGVRRRLTLRVAAEIWGACADFVRECPSGALALSCEEATAVP